MDVEKSRIVKVWKEKNIGNKNFYSVFKKIDRKNFVPNYLKFYAYKDIPLYLGQGNSLNSLTTIATLIDVLNPIKGDWVLELGTGTGYTTSLLSLLVGKKGRVYSFEVVKDFYFMAKENLKGFNNVSLFLGNGLNNNLNVPFDSILISFPLSEIPFFLFNNLKIGSIMVLFVGDFIQDLVKITKIGNNRFKKEFFGEFRIF